MKSLEVPSIPVFHSGGSLLVVQEAVLGATVWAGIFTGTSGTAEDTSTALLLLTNTKRETFDSTWQGSGTSTQTLL